MIIYIGTTSSQERESIKFPKKNVTLHKFRLWEHFLVWSHRRHRRQPNHCKTGNSDSE